MNQEIGKKRDLAIGYIFVAHPGSVRVMLLIGAPEILELHDLYGFALTIKKKMFPHLICFCWYWAFEILQKMENTFTNGIQKYWMKEFHFFFLLISLVLRTDFFPPLGSWQSLGWLKYPLYLGEKLFLKSLDLENSNHDNFVGILSTQIKRFKLPCKNVRVQ